MCKATVGDLKLEKHLENQRRLMPKNSETDWNNFVNYFGLLLLYLIASFIFDFQWEKREATQENNIICQLPLPGDRNSSRSHFVTGLCTHVRRILAKSGLSSPCSKKTFEP